MRLLEGDLGLGTIIEADVSEDREQLTFEIVGWETPARETGSEVAHTVKVE